MTPKRTDTVHFFDILGGRFTLGPEEYRALLNNRTTRGYIGFVYVLLVLTDAPDFFQHMDVLLVLILWVLVVAIFLFAVGVVVTLMAAIQHRLRIRIWPGPLIVVFALAPGISTGETVSYLATDGAVGFDLIPEVFLYWLIAETFGLIFFRYVRPSIEQTASPAERSILIGAEPVPLSRLRHIEAREHHVHVTLDGASLTHRARLGDIIAQTTPEDGVQPHRSWWVSAKAARALTRDGARHLLELDDGTAIPVARSRVEDVRDWLQRHG